MIQVLNRLFKDESGATAIEYGLIASLISVAIIGALSTVGSQISDTFTTIGEKLTAASAPAAPPAP